jgi:hypothetical protein
MWARGLARAAQPGRKESCPQVDGEGEGGPPTRAAAERERLELDDVAKGLPARALVEDELGGRWRGIVPCFRWSPMKAEVQPN